METDFVKQKSVDLSLGTLQILASKLGVHPLPSDLSLDDAQRFAEVLILVQEIDPAKKVVLEDQPGARAFLALAADSDLSTAYKDIELGSGNQPMELIFF